MIFEIMQHLSTIYTLLAVCVAALITIYLYIENCRVVYLTKRLPGPPALPLLGNGHSFLGQSSHSMYNIFMKFHEQYGPVVGIYIGPKVVISLTHPRDIKLILDSSSVHLDKSTEYRLFQSLIGDGLLITTGDKWHKHRKAIAPTFHISILKSFVPLFYENSMDLVRRLRDEIGKEFDCHEYLSAVTLDILTETTMGIKREQRQKTGYNYAMAIIKLSETVFRRTYDLSLMFDLTFKFSKLGRLQEKLVKIVHELTNNIIKAKSIDVEKMLATKEQQKKEQQNEKPIEKEKSDISYSTKMHYVRDDLDDIDESDVSEKKRLTFLETLITMKQTNGQMTDEEIWEEANTFMIAGHETTVISSSFALCVLGSLPDVQARVHKELDTIFGDSDRECTFSDTVEMKYLERVILETMRLFPPIPVIARRLKEDVKLATNDYFVPKDVTVMISPIATHRLEEFYPNPLDFNPDNFCPERMRQRSFYSYIPFSAGPRSCIGRKYAMLKLKVILSTLLRNYHVISDVHYKDFKLRPEIMLKKEDGFMIKIEPRKSAALRESESLS